jgi:glycine dehydrogenase subunit 1
MWFGGPSLGFFTTRKQYVHKMAGRLVGETVDSRGEKAYVLTLTAREQHIKRERATSNICTNQGLLTTAATIYMSILGPAGLRQVAAQSHANTRALADKLGAINGVQRAFTRPCFHETVLRLSKPAAQVLNALAERGILGGYDLAADFPELGDAVLVCATETKNADDLDLYATALRAALA